MKKVDQKHHYLKTPQIESLLKNYVYVYSQWNKPSQQKLQQHHLLLHLEVTELH